jgi:oligopeptide transport system substrate-binding protein
MLLSCGKSANNRSDQSEVLRRGLSGEPSTLDPAAAADNFSSEVLRDIYEGLTDESPSGEVVPGVASSWEVDSSGREYTFKLRPDARWSNGKPVIAEDFVNAWRRVVDPKQGSPVADDFRFLIGASYIIDGKLPVSELGVYAANDQTLIVKLVQPVPYLPQILTHAATYPIYSEASARGHDALVSVTNGPYSLKNWSPSTAIQLVRNEKYWDHTNVHISQVEYEFITDENIQYARFRAGQLDITDTVPPNALAHLRDDHSPELLIAPFLATAYYGFNLAKSPFDSNHKLREALALAIDRKKLVHALAAGQVEAFGFVPPGISNYTPQSWPWKDLETSEREAEAKRLFNEAGFSQERPLHLNLLINSNIGVKNTALIVASMWKDVLGIETQLTEEEYRVFLQSRHDKSRWDVVRLGWVADYNDASNFLDTFRQHSSNNDEGYRNQLFDSLLDNAANNQDSQKRREILQTSERTMLADYPVIPLYFFVSKRLVKPYIQGLTPNPLNHIPSKSLSIALR